jgi:XTP/dITP diphosphohydrolase
MQKIIIATHNQGKLLEFKQMFVNYNVDIVAAGELGISDPEETEDSFQGNALLKARHVCKLTGEIALADDSGLVVPALNGAPGIYTARWAGPERDFAKAMTKINNLLADKPREAYFECVLALVKPDGSECTFDGRTYGNLAWPFRGGISYGFDPMFVPEGDTRTYGEMTNPEKFKTSARAKAFDSFAVTMLGAVQKI